MKNKVEEIMKNYRKESEKIDKKYEVKEVKVPEKLDTKELDEKIKYEKEFIAKLESESKDNNQELIEKAKARLELAEIDKKEIEEKNQKADEKYDRAVARREEKILAMNKLKNSTVELDSGREVTMLEKDELDKMSLKDKAIRELTQESNSISEQLLSKNEELQTKKEEWAKNKEEELKSKQEELEAKRVEWNDFKYEFDGNGNPTNKDVVEKIHADYDKLKEEISKIEEQKEDFSDITKEMQELSKMQEDCNKYLTELKAPNKEHKEFEEAWNEAYKDEVEETLATEVKSKKENEDWTNELSAKQAARERLANTEGVGRSQEKPGWTAPRVKMEKEPETKLEVKPEPATKLEETKLEVKPEPAKAKLTKPKIKINFNAKENTYDYTLSYNNRITENELNREDAEEDGKNLETELRKFLVNNKITSSKWELFENFADKALINTLLDINKNTNQDVLKDYYNFFMYKNTKDIEYINFDFDMRGVYGKQNTLEESQKLMKMVNYHKTYKENDKIRKGFARVIEFLDEYTPIVRTVKNIQSKNILKSPKEIKFLDRASNEEEKAEKNRGEFVRQVMEKIKNENGEVDMQEKSQEDKSTSRDSFVDSLIKKGQEINQEKNNEKAVISEEETKETSNTINPKGEER